MTTVQRKIGMKRVLVATLVIVTVISAYLVLSPTRRCERAQERLYQRLEYQLVPDRAAYAAKVHCRRHGNVPEVWSPSAEPTPGFMTELEPAASTSVGQVRDSELAS